MFSEEGWCLCQLAVFGGGVFDYGKDSIFLAYTAYIIESVVCIESN